MADLRTGDIVMVRLPDEFTSLYGVLVNNDGSESGRVPELYRVLIRHDKSGTPVEPKTVSVPATRITSYEALCAWAGPIDWVERDLVES